MDEDVSMSARVSELARIVRSSKCTDEQAARALGLPLFVKPVRAGSSFGITRVARLEELQEGETLTLGLLECALPLAQALYRPAADDLVETLTSMDGAACLAANQIGATTCIIAYLDDDDQPHVMYNPRLLQALGAFKAVEGCLSLEADSKVTRFDRIKVGYSELVDGELKPRKKDFNGWTAQIIQHGIDHCKGKLV